MCFNKTIFTSVNKTDKNYFLTDLCLKVWKKNLPEDFNICVVNQSDVFYSANELAYDKGSVFLCAETILTPNFLRLENLLSHYEVVLFGESRNNFSDKFLMSKSLSKKQNIDFANKKWLQDLLQQDINDRFIIVDIEKSGFLMEKTLYGVSNKQTFQSCYFSNCVDVEEFFSYSKGVSFLNKEFVPEKYNQITSDEFLEQDILLAKIFKKLLAL